MLKKLFAFLLLCALSAWAVARELPDFTQLVEKEGPAVVNISTVQKVKARNPMLEDDPFGDFFRFFGPFQYRQAPRDQPPAQSLGSGFIIDQDGYILTNAHVVRDASEVKVRLTDKREFKAKVVGSDTRTDVALLKIEAKNLPKVDFANLEKLKVGEWVVAIGSPFGFENTVTAGIVSGKGRSLADEGGVPFIQTDVAVNPGNSGGPLFNMQGEVVGINSQIYSRTGGYMGLSFAIPIDVAMQVADQLRSHGRVSRGRLGVAIQELSRELADSFGLSKAGGALVTAVEPGLAADKAGVQVGDVVLGFNSVAIEKSSDLPRALMSSKPGQKAELRVWRQKAEKHLMVTLSEAKDNPADVSGDDANVESENAPWGLVLRELSQAQKQEMKLSFALVVESVQGAAARSGLEPGDIILGVANHSVKTLADFRQLFKQSKAGDSVALLVKRGNNTMYIPFKFTSDSAGK